MDLLVPKMIKFPKLIYGVSQVNEFEIHYCKMFAPTIVHRETKIFHGQLLQLAKYFLFPMKLLRARRRDRGVTRDTPPLKSYARDILKLNVRRCRIMSQNGELYLTSH